MPLEQLILTVLATMAKSQCELCPKEFSTAGSLREHEAVDHRGEFARCRFCRKEFKGASNRRKHERSCSDNPKAGAKDRRCQHCHYKGRSDNFKRHMQKKHPEHVGQNGLNANNNLANGNGDPQGTPLALPSPPLSPAPLPVAPAGGPSQQYLGQLTGLGRPLCPFEGPTAQQADEGFYPPVNAGMPAEPQAVVDEALPALPEGQVWQLGGLANADAAMDPAFGVYGPLSDQREEMAWPVESVLDMPAEHVQWLQAYTPLEQVNHEAPQQQQPGDDLLELAPNEEFDFSDFIDFDLNTGSNVGDDVLDPRL